MTTLKWKDGKRFTSFDESEAQTAGGKFRVWVSYGVDYCPEGGEWNTEVTDLPTIEEAKACAEAGGLGPYLQREPRTPS